MVQNLLALAREQPEAGEMLAQKVDMSRLVESMAEEYFPFAKEKNIRLTVLPEDRDVFIKGEEQSLRILIGNLLHNAITYTPENGKVDIGVVLDKQFVVLSVTDDGTGIAEPDRARIFDRFYRVLGTKTTGSGLGLSIVKAIADKHGAKITVRGNNGEKGTRFTLSFPVCND